MQVSIPALFSYKSNTLSGQVEPIRCFQKTFRPEPIIWFRRKCWFLYILFFHHPVSSTLLILVICIAKFLLHRWRGLSLCFTLSYATFPLGLPPPLFLACWRVSGAQWKMPNWLGSLFFCSLYWTNDSRLWKVPERSPVSRQLEVLFSLNASSFIPPIYLLLFLAPVPLSSSFSDRKQPPCCVSPITAAILIPSLSPVLSPPFSPAISRSA